MNKKQVKELKIKEVLSPEEILACSRRAKLRFRSAVRFVIQNLYWLTDVEDDELGEDVQKNILVLTKRKGLLSLKEKGLLSKPAEYRTDEEKELLGKKISGLKCFRRYPTEVKKKLSGVSYYYYYRPGRTIIREGHEANALYFILTGEVIKYQNFYDPIKETMESRDIGSIKAGNIFGEVTLLHNLPRICTIVSRTDVELLCLKKDDFNVVLKATVQQQWDAIKNAMLSFTYFDDWDANIIRDGCILGKLKTFRPDETILGDGSGNRNYVYFICSGRCQVIEHLMLESEIKGARKCFKIYVPPSSDSDSDLLALDDVLKMAQERKSQTKQENEDDDILSQSKVEVLSLGKEETMQNDNKKLDPKRRDSAVSFKASDSAAIISTSTSKFSKNAEQDTPGQLKKSSSTDFSSNISVHKSPSKRSSNITTDTTSKRSTSVASNIYLPPNVETYFMQVCVLNAKSCFNIGENLQHRRVVATKATQCLMIPYYWLMQQNKGNIWNRIRQFLETHIPTTRKVFKEFLKQRQWRVYRRKIFEDLRAKTRVTTNNEVCNVPYFYRINEELPIY